MSGVEAVIHKYSIFVSMHCLHNDHGSEPLLEVLSFTCEGFSFILLDPMNITWIKPNHMVSNSYAIIILPVLT